MRVIGGFPTPQAYCELRHEMGWSSTSPASVERAFNASLASTSIFEGGALRAFARVVGDTTLYLYLQDVMVAREFQRNGLGTIIVRALTDGIRNQLEESAFVGLLAVPGSERFYETLGFARQKPQHTVMELHPGSA